MARNDPPLAGSERAMLVGWLDFHRETLAMKCEGLTALQLDQRSVPPSSLSLAGLIRHLAEIERTYFRRTFAGEDVAPVPFEDDPFREDPSVDYSAAADSDPLVALTAWRADVEVAREIIARADDLEDTGDSGLPLRFWLIKTLNEYARHNGHADLLRERIDGMTGE